MTCLQCLHSILLTTVDARVGRPAPLCFPASGRHGEDIGRPGELYDIGQDIKPHRPLPSPPPVKRLIFSWEALSAL